MTRRHSLRARRNPTQSLWELLNLGTPEDTAWMADAVCAQTDPDAFFPDRGGSARAAKAVCLSCPVRSACLAYALEHGELCGIWGGLSPEERHRLLRDHAAAPTGEEAA